MYCMIKIDLLKNNLNAKLAHIWNEVLGKIWFLDLKIQEIESLTYDEPKHQDETILFVVLHVEILVGFCTFKLREEEFRHDLGQLLTDVVVDPKKQNQGISTILLEELGFEKLYLFAFDYTVPEYYKCLGWKKRCFNEFRLNPVMVMEVTL